ncbi:hypothetical protein F2Q69_00047370 [Brassica cretica]|uniref:Uncharacterized protein n=1 Tax=Brassica cretica TaxID=69181 RepID=A0A8S9Q0J7_BRACR|nr:hypothetical protein F2Q69_00047370 [Brassica cretica]
MKTARSFQLGHPPNWSRVRSSSAIRRAGHVFDPARPSAELDWSSSADGRTSRVFDPDRRMAELVGRVVDPARPSAELVILVDPARPPAELDGVLCPPFNKTGITYATGC